MRDRRPLPLQVRDSIRGLISEEVAPGEQLPSEAVLATRFDVGRTTVREALKLLEQDGLVDVRHGRGRFAAAVPSLERPLTRLESVTEMMDGLGFRVTNRVLEVVRLPGTLEETGALQLTPGSEVIHLRRWRLQDAVPLIYSDDVVPAAAFPGTDSETDWSGSLLELLEARGERITSATARIRSVTLPLAVAEGLSLPAEEPWLLMTQTNFTEGGRPVLYSHDYHRGDSFSFQVLRRRAD